MIDFRRFKLTLKINALHITFVECNLSVSLFFSILKSHQILVGIAPSPSGRAVDN